MNHTVVADGSHSLTRSLFVADATCVDEFYKTACVTEELPRIAGPNGSVAHAEFRIGDSRSRLAEESRSTNGRGQTALGGSPVCLMFCAPYVDAISRAALVASELRPLAVPFGQVWTIATHQDDVAPDELQRRADALASGQTC